MTRPRKTLQKVKREHVGADVLEYFRARDAEDPEFAALSLEERGKRQLANRIREIREQKGLSQAELAERLGTKQPSIARIESGRSLPRLEMLFRIATVLDFLLQIDFVEPPKKRRRKTKAKEMDVAAWPAAEQRPGLR